MQTVQYLSSSSIIHHVPTLTYKWNSPGVRKPPFYVETSYDRRLRELLSEPPSSASAAAVPIATHRQVWIQGIAGSGKTSLAQAYLANFLAENPNERFGYVLLADNFKNFQISLLSLAAALVGVAELKAYLKDLKEAERAAAITQIIQQGLSQKQWVLVIDNVDQEAREIWTCLEQLSTATQNGQLIFTSQHPPMVTSLATLDISSGLNLTDSRRLLHEILAKVTAQISLGTEADLEALISKTNGLPLALSLAGHYLKQVNQAAARLRQEASLTYAAYSQLLEESFSSLQDKYTQTLGGNNNSLHPRDKDNPEFRLVKTQEAAVRLSLRKAIGLQEGAEANLNLWRLLCFCGFLPSDDIPQVLLTHYLTELGTHARLAELLEQAQHYSLIQISSELSAIDEKPSLHLHRVVQKLLREEFWPEWVQREKAKVSQSNTWLEWGRSLLTMSRQQTSVETLELTYQGQALTEVLSQLIKQHSFRGCELWVGLLNAYIRLSQSLAKIDSSREIMLWQGRYYRQLSDCSYLIGHYEEARQYAEQSHNCLVSFYNTEEHVEVARTLHNLAIVYGALGDMVKKKELLEKVLRIEVAHYKTEEHVEVARTLHSLANATGALGDVVKQKELLEKVLRIEVAHYQTEEHVEVATTLHNLANATGALGDVVKQKELLEKVLRIQVAHYKTEEHVEVARTLHNLAIAVGALGDVVKQKELLEKVLRIEVAHYKTEEHIEVARTLHNLANATGALGDVVKQKELLEKVLRIQVAHYKTEEHIEVARTLANLAIAVGDLGDVVKQKELLEKVLRIQVAHYKTEEHIEVARTLHNLANATGALGDVVKQKELLEKVLRIKVAHYKTEEHVEVARTLHSLANATGALGDVVKEKELLEKVLRIFVAHYKTEEHVEVARTLHNLANATGALGDVVKEKALLEKVLRIFVAHYKTEEHVEVARTLANLAIAVGALGDMVKKKELLEKVLRIQVAHYKTDKNRTIANTCFNLAYAHRRLNDHQNAATCMEKAYLGYKAQLGIEHAETQDAYQRWQRLKQEADSLMQQSAQSSVSSLGAAGLFGRASNQAAIIESAGEFKEPDSSSVTAPANA